MKPGPKRGAGSWDDILQRPAKTLWACHLFSKKFWTPNGRVDLLVLFFLHLGSRRVHVTGVTAHPDKAWMVQQARNVSMLFAEQPDKPRFLLRDHDSKFVKEFDALLEGDGIEVIAVGPMAPNLNAYAERWVQSIKQECLDHFLVCGEEHFRHLVTEYLAHYNGERPHQGKDNLPLTGTGPAPPTDRLGPAEVVCEARLGGLLKHYHRAS